MKIGLIQVDGKLPNYALMQICGYHEMLGDEVEWFNGIVGPLVSSEYDKVYVSKIFSFSELPALPAGAIVGGTGVDFKNKLPVGIAEAEPSYSLYPDCNFHIGFSMKGCRFRCAFCCVPVKEGKPVMFSRIPDILTCPNGGDRLMLLDNDFFGIPEWQVNLQTIIELGLQVCFAQGLNIRILTDEQAELLGAAKFRTSRFNKRRVTFAWDRFKDRQLVLDGIERCTRYGIKPENMQFYVLIGYDTTPEQDMLRIVMLRDKGCYPYVMPYDKSDPYQQDFARWVNHKAIFGSVKWEDYRRSVKKRKSDK